MQVDRTVCSLSVDHLLFYVCFMKTFERHNILVLPGYRFQYLVGTNMYLMGLNKIKDTEFETGWIFWNSHFKIRFIAKCNVQRQDTHRENQI